MNLTVTVKNTKRGYTHTYRGNFRVTIPQWLFEFPDRYATYYICHEMAHVTHHELYNTFDHNDTFKAIETMYCADFGIIIEYKKAYPKTLIVFGTRYPY